MNNKDLNQKRKIRKQKEEYFNSIKLENFKKEELEFLEQLSKYSAVKTAMKALNKINSQKTKIDFIKENYNFLSVDERIEFERATNRRRDMQDYSGYFGLACGAGLLLGYLMVRPKTYNMNFDIAKSLGFGGVGFGGWRQYWNWRFDGEVDEVFRRAMDEKVSFVDRKQSLKA